MVPEPSLTKADRIAAVLPEVEALLRACVFCGHRCGVDRLAGRRGFCDTPPGDDPRQARCASHTLHFGEEPMLVGRGGSGTVFFAHCNLRCVFCQNHQISQGGLGHPVGTSTLADIFLDLERAGAENINLVTPTHYAYPILLALEAAYRRGLGLPVVWNTNGYDTLELLRLLDGIVDVYLPDMKYMEVAQARKYSAGEDYPAVAQTALVEMYRQVGGVVMSGHAASRGLIIRHLVLPHDLAGSYALLLWLKDASLTGATLGLMSQYSPQHRARDYPELYDRVSLKEYRDLVEYAADLGFDHLLAQGLDSTETYLPDFHRPQPFRDAEIQG